MAVRVPRGGPGVFDGGRHLRGATKIKHPLIGMSGRSTGQLSLDETSSCRRAYRIRLVWSEVVRVDHVDARNAG